MILFAIIALIDVAIIVLAVLNVPLHRLLVDLLLFVVIMGPVVAAGAMRLSKHETPADDRELVGSPR